MADNKFTFLGEYKSLKSKEICPLFEDNNVNIWGHCSYSQRLRITCIKDIGLGTPNLGTNKTSFSGRVLTGVDIRQSCRKSFSKLYFWLWRINIGQDKIKMCCIQLLKSVETFNFDVKYCFQKNIYPWVLNLSRNQNALELKATHHGLYSEAYWNLYWWS